MNDIMQKAVNDQIQAEFYSAYLYLSMSAYYEAQNLPGFANWMRMQAQEEQIHAMKFFDYLNDRGGRVELLPIQAPQVEFETPATPFKMAYEHEQLVTSLINNLYKLAVEQDDFAAQSMLKWFIDEQVEEEKSALEIVEQLSFVGEHKMGLFMLDRELAQRTAPAPGAEGEAA